MKNPKKLTYQTMTKKQWEKAPCCLAKCRACSTEREGYCDKFDLLLDLEDFMVKLNKRALKARIGEPLVVFYLNWRDGKAKCYTGLCLDESKGCFPGRPEFTLESAAEVFKEALSRNGIPSLSDLEDQQLNVEQGDLQEQPESI